jgi:hypothetical protein
MRPHPCLWGPRKRTHVAGREVSGDGTPAGVDSSRLRAFMGPLVQMTARHLGLIGSELNFLPTDDLRTRGSPSGPFPWSVALQGSYTMTPRAARKI